MDASEAGEGSLEILVSAEDTNIPTRVEPLGNARFQVSFVPEQEADHRVFVTFNEEVVHGESTEGYYVIWVVSAEAMKVSEEGIL